MSRKMFATLCVCLLVFIVPGWLLFFLERLNPKAYLALKKFLFSSVPFGSEANMFYQLPLFFFLLSIAVSFFVLLFVKEGEPGRSSK